MNIMLRLKVRWLEEEERCTQYFFELEKFNYNKKQIRKIILDNDKTITTDSEILKESAKLYENLYKSKISNEEGNPVEALCSNTIIPELNTLEKSMCDSEITEKECYEGLVNFKNNKSRCRSVSRCSGVVFWGRFLESIFISYSQITLGANMHI